MLLLLSQQVEVSHEILEEAPLQEARPRTATCLEIEQPS
jgi:hypothetical protein